MRKLFLIIFVLSIFGFFGIIYLNKIILPIKIKSLIISSLQEATHKKASLESLEFNIFKGLVLKNLTLYDGTKTIASIKEGSFTFLLLPILKKKIIIPNLGLKAPQILLERGPDNTLNIMDLFPKKESKLPKKKFSILVYRVKITDGRINFKDNTLIPAFNKTMDNLDLIINLALPTRIKFDFSSEIPAKPLTKIQASGEFNYHKKQLTAKVAIKDFSPHEFLDYYRNLGISPEGKIDVWITANFKDDILNADLIAQNKGLTISKNKIIAKLNSKITTNLHYSIIQKQLEYSGKASFDRSEILGLEPVGSIIDVSGEVKFNNSNLFSDKLNANILGIPVEAKFNITNFRSPVVQLSLFSKDLILESDLAFKDSLISVSRCKGRYINSQFSMGGSIDTQHAPHLETELNGELNIDLKDTKILSKRFQKQLETINPDGVVQTKFNLEGDLSDIKSSTIGAMFSSSSLSAFGLKATEFFLDYNQTDGLAKISRVHLSLYDGVVEANASMNLNSPELPFWMSADIQELNLEKLKIDTPAREKDIAGTLVSQLKVNGFLNDLSKLNGVGKVMITDGKLWQLNLFKGLGELLFAKDFGHIIFSEGYCRFIIQDKYILSDDLKLKSNFVNLTGTYKIGFDSSIDASLNIEVLDEFAPMSGTFKDVTTAILGQAGRFGIIKITGTLKEPKYKFKTAVVDIIKGLKDTIFGTSPQP